MTEPSDWAHPGEKPDPGSPPNPPPGYPPPDPGRPTGGVPAPSWSGPGPGGPPPNARPGIIPLRPLGLGEILDGAISFIRGNPRTALGLSAAVVVVVALLDVVATLLLGGTTLPDPARAFDDPEGYLAASEGFVGAAGVGAVLWFLALAVLTGLLIVALSQAVLGKVMGIGEAWREARPRLLGLLGITVLQTLLVAAVFTAGLLPGLLVGLLGGGGAAGGLLLLIGVLVGLAASVYLWVSWSLVGPIYMLEHAGVRTAFRRSRTLVTPRWWRVFGILLLTGILAFIFGQILGIPFSFAAGLLSEVVGDGSTVLTPAALLLGAIGTVLAQTLTAPFQAGVTSLIYFDQRIRREALDLTLQRAVGG